MIDATPLGELTARVMDHIETLGPALGEGYVIRTAAIVVELDSPRHGRLVCLGSDDRPWALAAFLDEAIRAIDDERDEIRRSGVGDGEDDE